jgi:hypothetical protein
MLSKNYQTFRLLCNSLSQEATIVVEAVDVTFITGVEKYWSCCWVPVSWVNEIADFERVTVAAWIKVIDISFEKEFLWVCFGNADCKSS